MKKIAIIGGGPAGLCAARHLYFCQSDVKLQPVIFEQQECIGGTWVYKDVENPNEEVISSIYKNLKTNLPKEVMCFPDFRYPEAGPSYMHHTTVLKYIEDYAEHFNLKQFIEFSTKVTAVSPILPVSQLNKEMDRFVQWNVESQNLLSNKITSEVYDAVLVCSGHYTKPITPDIQGIKHFKGEMLHSHFYRDPSIYKDKTIMILGNGPSGTDIMCELCDISLKVYFCHRGGGEPKRSEYKENVIELSNIKYVDENGLFVFENDYKVQADVFIVCTGYLYDYPYLSSTCDIEIKHDGRVLTPLYKHLIHTKYPSLSFVGIPWKNIPLPVMHQQCAYLANILSSVKVLPTEVEMNKDTEEEIQENNKQGQPPRYFHKFGIKQFSYNDELAELSGCEKNPEILKNLYLYTMKVRRINLHEYKTKNYKQIDSKSFECCN